MGTQDADDQVVFEIVDFTTASEWECFIAAVEETVHDWRLAGERHRASLTRGQLAAAKWREKAVVIKFADFSFKLAHHSIINETTESPPEESEPSTDHESEDEPERQPLALDDLMNRENDFPARAHCLVRWYGLGEFIILTPANPSQAIMQPAKSKLLLSSLTIAANNTNCQVPMFVHVLRGNEKMYLGVGVGGGVRTDYDMVHLKRPPTQCSHLAGLLDVFRNKVGWSVIHPPALVSVRLTYVLTEWPHTLWTQQPPDFDATLTEVGFSDLGNLPFGALSDPVSELQVSATWPCVSEDVLVDSEAYSDLDPGSAPLWTSRLVTAAAPPCLLSEYLTEFLTVCRNSDSLTQILGPDFTQDMDEPAQFSSALDRLTESSVPTISTMVGRVKMEQNRKRRSISSQAGECGPIPTDILVPVLNYLFPDAEADDPTAPYPLTFTQIPEWPVQEGEDQEHPLKSLLSNLKSSGVECLVWRLGVVLCHVVHCLGGLGAAAHLWHEMVLELRFRWEHSIIVPGVAPGPPDLASTLLHQKLQMLNCCITRKKAREQYLSRSDNDEADDEEEFYECEEEMEEDERSGEPRSSWDKPEGRLKRCGRLRLLHTPEPLFVPVTQEPAPMTEDKLEEHQNALLRLGTDTVASHLRARLMSPTLLSDMESFKAANPGAVLEDFVRWYSPRDWIDEPGEADPTKPPQGNLSTRMQLPGNMWKEVWNNAKPVPARRQKRLFDDTRAAEEALHWLSSLGPGAVCTHLLSTILHVSLCRLAQERLLFTLPATTSLPQPRHSNTLATVLDVIAQRVVRLSRQPPDTHKCQEVVDQIAEVEACIAQAQSVRHKILEPGYQEVVDQIAEVEVCIARAQSVRHKILGNSWSQGVSEGEEGPLEELVMRLLDSPEVTLEGGPQGPQALAIRSLFQQAHKASQLLDDSPQESTGRAMGSSVVGSSGGGVSELGTAAGREYLLRTRAPSPSPSSRQVPHRMYAVLLPNEIRLAGAFSQDTTFC